MGTWNRAYLYVTRKKARSILLFVIFFVTGLLLITGFAVRKGAVSSAGEFRKSLTAGITIDWRLRMDIEAVMDYSTNEKGELVANWKIPMMKEEYVDDFLAMEGVCGFYRDLGRETAYTGLTVCPGFQTRYFYMADGTLPPETEDERVYVEHLKTMDTEELDQFWQEMKSTETGMHSNDFMEVYDSEWHPAFVNGAVELVQGRHVRPGDNNTAMISEELAALNGLQIGDTVSARNFDFITGETYGSLYEAEIIGIFRVNFEQKITEWTWENDILSNVLFCSRGIGYWGQVEYNTHYMREVIAKESEENMHEMILFVEEPGMLDSVKEQLLQFDAIDWSQYDVGIYDDDYQAVAAPLLMMEKLSRVMIVALTAGAGILLFLILSLWIRGRRHEAGVLCAVGVEQKEVLMQFLLESCGIACFAFLAAALLSGPISGRIGSGFQSMLESTYGSGAYEVRLEEGTRNLEILMQPVKGTDVSYAVAPIQLCLVFFILIGTAAVSTVVSSRKVLKRKPREILEKK